MEEILSDEFVFTLNNIDSTCRVVLTEYGIGIHEGRERHSFRLKYIHLSDVIGAKVHYGAKDNVFLIIHYLPLTKNRFNGKLMRCKKQVVLCAVQHETQHANVRQCVQWKSAIKRLIFGPSETSESRCRDRKYLIFVNPKGGKKAAKKIWLNTVEPLFEIAGIECEVVYTEYSGHSRDYVQTCKNIYTYTSIVTVSGDGIVFEVFNGLMKREDWEEAIKIPLSIIPGGSGNGLCGAILHQSGVPLTLIDAVFVAIRGTSTPLDLVKVEQAKETVWSFLSIAWGLLSAVDIESEGLRWMGEARFTVEAVKKLVSFPVKSGRVWFSRIAEPPLVPSKLACGSPMKLPREKGIQKEALASISERPRHDSSGSNNSADTDIDDLDPAFDFSELNEANSDSDEASQVISERIPDRSRTVSECPAASSSECKCRRCLTVAPVDKEAAAELSQRDEKIGLTDPIPEDWTMVDGNFATVMAFTLTHLSLGYQCASEMRLDAGFVYLMHSKGGSKKDFLKLLLQDCTPESNDTRTIQFEKVRAFRLEPEVSESGAYVTIDGELVPYEPLHACIYKGLARVMCLPTPERS